MPLSYTKHIMGSLTMTFLTMLKSNDIPSGVRLDQVIQPLLNHEAVGYILSQAGVDRK